MINLLKNYGGNEMGEQLEPFVMKSEKKAGIGKKIGIFILILIVIFILFLIASVAIKSYNKSKCTDKFYVQQEALEYLQERYNEEFIVMYNRGMSGAYNYVQLYAYPTTHRDEMHKIEIQGYYNKWGKLDYYDDYVMVKLTEEYETYVDGIIEQYYEEYKFFLEFQGEWLTNNLPADTKLEDLWELKANEDYPLPALFVYMSPKEENNQYILKEFLESLKQKNYRGRVDIWYMKDEERYELAERDNWGEIMKYNDYDDAVTYFIYTNEIKSMEE